jgi:hypothetical protein
MMTATDPGTGIYLVTVQLADFRTLEYAGTEDEADEFLAELGSAATIVERHEMDEAELAAFGPIWSSPGTSEEDDEAPWEDDEDEEA